MSYQATMPIETLIYCGKSIRRNGAMKYPMDKTLGFEVEIKYESIKHGLPNLKSREIVAGILSEFETKGYASRFVRKDGRIGWRATDRLREELY
jgi:hypothetical protein